MLNLFDQFVDDPTANTYLALRTLLLKDATYSTLTIEMADVARLIEQRQYSNAMELLDSLQPGCLLSPRLHMHLALIGERVGDQEQLEVERFLFRCCLDGILDTGSGDRRSPFIVTHSTDIADVLRTLEVKQQSQVLTTFGDRQFDIVTSDRGDEYCFDVTDVLRPEEVTAWRQETLMN